MPFLKLETVNTGYYSTQKWLEPNVLYTIPQYFSAI